MTTQKQLTTALSHLGIRLTKLGINPYRLNAFRKDLANFVKESNFQVETDDILNLPSYQLMSKESDDSVQFTIRKVITTFTKEIQR